MSKRCGYVALIGRPNVGKSTLLNNILQTKISITSKKPQTTQKRILGIKTQEDTQIIFVDTPGIHLKAKSKLNRYMNKAASTAIHDVDVIIYMVVALQWTAEDQFILEMLKKVEVPVILAINQIDTLADKEQLLPFIEKLNQLHQFQEIFPLSAAKGLNVEKLTDTVSNFLPSTPEFYFPAEQITDNSEPVLAAELIREKLLRFLGQEVPYAAAVQIEEFKREEKILRIGAVIWVERDSQKAIVIGEQGSKLKQIGQQARIEMERIFGMKVFLRVWVKVKESWRDDPRSLQKFGYGEE